MQAPPPSAALERALVGLRPIRTRRPAHVLLGVAGASLAYAAALVWKLGLRGDLATLRLVPFVLYASACLSTFLALLWCALVPPRGQVLPSGTTAGRLAIPLLGVLCGLDVAMGAQPLVADAHAAPMALADFSAIAARCLTISFGVVTVPLALGLGALRRLLPVSSWRVLLALGGAAGALSALVLHLHCAVSDAAHVVVVHGAALLLPAAALVSAAIGRLSCQPTAS